ncbi:cysteine protease ATG4B [Biomphalaria glabrata]|nr:cysteine protease ATG4B [Biomphalaria glabrata]
MEYESSLGLVNFSTFTYESGPLEFEDFPITKGPAYILGQKYNTRDERDELKHDIKSRLWITYRRGFPNIGGTGPSSDQGWGCMLRCGQMMLAHTLILRHLGRGWRWKPYDVQDDKYWKILKMFEDKKCAIYSIHQIASMGEAEGKAIGQWFGPNTIAQVLKRISVYDNWSDLAIHVALDNVVILDEIRSLCKTSAKPSTSQQPSEEGLDLGNNIHFSDFVNADPSHKAGPPKPGPVVAWKPLLLIIPLRLGLTDINPIYFDSLKKCFTLRQSVGIIGGKPNHAHWFIGYADDELYYLDPHTNQNVVDLEDRERQAVDVSYHCSTPPSRMIFSKLDPSIALGFYCKDEEDFNNWCQVFSSPVQGFRPMFELRKEAPTAWSYEEVVAPVKKAKKPPQTTPFSDLFCDEVSSTGSNNDEEEFEFL